MPTKTNIIGCIKPLSDSNFVTLSPFKAPHVDKLKTFLNFLSRVVKETRKLMNDRILKANYISTNGFVNKPQPC